MSAAASSSSPEPVMAPSIKEKKKSKDQRKKAKSSHPTVIITDHGKNEGTNPHWAYKAPDGAVLLEHNVDAGDFDWDAVKNDEDVELWLIRVPQEVKPKYLESTKIKPPSSSRSSRLGSLNRKNASYDIWSVGDDDEQSIGGEEVKGLSCLLPRKKKGKLYAASKPIARHIVVSAQPTQPTPDPSLVDPAHLHQNPPRFSYPKEYLKHRFMPYGSQAPSDDLAAPMDVDTDMGGQDAANKGAPPAVPPETPSKKAKDGKAKKRKVDSDTPKKSKKAKTTE